MYIVVHVVIRGRATYKGWDRASWHDNSIPGGKVHAFIALSAKVRRKSAIFACPTMQKLCVRYLVAPPLYA